MSENPSARKGSYIPFPVPIPVTADAVELDDGEPVYLCLNDYWQPMVIGALKALARDETYRGADNYRQSHVEVARNLMTNFCACAPPTSDWYLSDELGPTTTRIAFWRLVAEPLGQHTADCWQGIYHAVVGGIEVAFHGHAYVDGSACGGLFQNWFAQSLQGEADFSLEITRCDETVDSFATVAEHWTVNGEEGTVFRVFTENPGYYLISATVVPPILCSVA